MNKTNINKPLYDYLKKNKMSFKSFGELFTPTVTDTAVSHWVNKKCVPTLERIEQIRKITRGKVNYKSFLSST